MKDAAIYILAIIGASSVPSLCFSAFLYFRDRTGNSGRQTHWESNPRIVGKGK